MQNRNLKTAFIIGTPITLALIVVICIMVDVRNEALGYKKLIVTKAQPKELNMVKMKVEGTSTYLDLEIQDIKFKKLLDFENEVTITFKITNPYSSSIPIDAPTQYCIKTEAFESVTATRRCPATTGYHLLTIDGKDYQLDPDALVNKDKTYTINMQSRVSKVFTAKCLYVDNLSYGDISLCAFNTSSGKDKTTGCFKIDTKTGKILAKKSI